MKKMIFISLLVCFSLTNIVSAQDTEKDDNRRTRFEQIKAKRMAFISEKVQFTPAEAEAFWPLCNELQEKKFELNKPLRDERRAMRESKKEITNADYLKLIDTNADIKIKEAQIDKEYLEKFKKILSPEKIFKYQQAEDEFMRQTLTDRSRRSGQEKR